MLVNDSVGNERFDRARRVPQFFESFARMFSVHRSGMRDDGRRAREPERKTDHLVWAPGLIRNLMNESSKLNLRIGKNLIELVNRTAGNSRVVECVDPFGGSPSREDGIKNHVQVTPVPYSIETPGESRIHRQFRTANGFRKS